MTAFSTLLIAELGIALFLALILFGFVHPTPFLHVFRGGESATPLAFIIIVINAIVVVANPDFLSHPNTWLAASGTLSITLVMCLLGARIIHFLRPSHAKANHQQRKILVQSLKDDGMSDMEVDNLIQQARSKNEYRHNN